MKPFNEFINESIDNTIFEGFLDKLKDAIENVVDNPEKYEKYISKAKEKINKEFSHFNGDDLKALKEMNNDKTIKEIYKWVKPYYKHYENDKMDYDDKAIAFCYSDRYSDRAKELASKKFPNYNPIATLEIASALFNILLNEYRNGGNSSTFHSSSSSNKKAAAIGAASAVAIAMRR